MKKINLIKVNHDIKIGNKCPAKTPTIIEDSLFYDEGKLIGFYITKITGKLKQYIEIANNEFNSSRVPKTIMSRGPQGSKKDKLERQRKGVKLVEQLSTIIGSVPPQPQMRRDYPSLSSVHLVASAKTYIKAMLLSCLEAEAIIKKIMPEQYEFQKQCIIDNVPKQYRFGNLFTSSIANYNISAPYHIDTRNLKGCVNVIITKKLNATGGDLNVPDYNTTMDSANDSLLVYPAWKNIHGVTPIQTNSPNGYRNSLIFYPLKSFRKFVEKKECP